MADKRDAGSLKGNYTVKEGREKSFFPVQENEKRSKNARRPIRVIISLSSRHKISRGCSTKNRQISKGRPGAREELAYFFCGGRDAKMKGNPLRKTGLETLQRGGLPLRGAGGAEGEIVAQGRRRGGAF